MDYNRTIEKIRYLVRGENLCDNDLYELLCRHGCYYLLAQSSYYHERIKPIIYANTLVLNDRYRHIKSFLEKISDLPYAHIKGVPLAKRIYGNPAYRVSNDIDFLVKETFSNVVSSFLISDNFIQGEQLDDTVIAYTRERIVYHKAFTHQMAPFIKKTESKLCQYICVDINCDIMWGECDFKINTEDFILHSEITYLYGIPVKQLLPEWEFIALCMHHYKDMNSIYLLVNRGLCLSQFCDIYYYILNVRPDKELICKISQEHHIYEYVYYCIYYTYIIFSDDILIPYLEALISPRSIQLLTLYGLNNSERSRWTIPFFERLFEPEFRYNFYKILSPNQKNKITINNKYM